MKTDCETYTQLRLLGLEPDEVGALFRAAHILHRWDELCVGLADRHVERDEDGLPWLVIYPPHTTEVRRVRVPDRERAALNIVRQVMARLPGCWWYHQADPRGAPLYVGRYADLPSGGSLDACYLTGIAITA